MITGRSLDALPFLSTFQNGRLEKMLKIKNGNFPISAHNYHLLNYNVFVYIYVFEGAEHNEIGFEQLTRNAKGQNPRWPPILKKKIIICRG